MSKNKRRKVCCENCVKWERNNKLTGWCNVKDVSTDAGKRRLCNKFLDMIDQKLKEVSQCPK
jgi:hypothetical protein